MSQPVTATERSESQRRLVRVQSFTPVSQRGGDRVGKTRSALRETPRTAPASPIVNVPSGGIRPLASEGIGTRFALLPTTGSSGQTRGAPRDVWCVVTVAIFSAGWTVGGLAAHQLLAPQPTLSRAASDRVLAADSGAAARGTSPGCIEPDAPDELAKTRDKEEP